MSVTFGDWTAHQVSDELVVDPQRVAALHALFDDGSNLPQIGAELPPLWHWAALSRWAPASQLGPDGHPRRGSLMPPVALPRRMFAGGSVEFSSPIYVGDTVQRTSIVDSVSEKNGSSGTFVIVGVTTTLAVAGTVRWTEKQNIIYRPAPDVSPQLPNPVAAATELAGPPLRRQAHWKWELRTDPALLLRFSAATSNAHRIHYDIPYATHIEGYPQLVVHGPLSTLSLLQIARLEGITDIARIEHRNLAPLFCGQPATAQLSTNSSSTTNNPGPESPVTLDLVSDGQPRTRLTMWATDRKAPTHA